MGDAPDHGRPFAAAQAVTAVSDFATTTDSPTNSAAFSSAPSSYASRVQHCQCEYRVAVRATHATCSARQPDGPSTPLLPGKPVSRSKPRQRDTSAVAVAAQAAVSPAGPEIDAPSI